MNQGMLSRARGCLLGQISGDALGAQVEFLTPEEILHQFPNGVRNMTDGGSWNLIAGQITDDSEMAITLARTLVRDRKYDAAAARRAYQDWERTGPYDIGATTLEGLRGRPNLASQANGALMRVSPLGIFGANHSLEDVSDWAQLDAEITHPHEVCKKCNSLYTMAISYSIRNGTQPVDLYEQIISWADTLGVGSSVSEVIDAAAYHPPRDYVTNQGWVLVALHNALWQLLHAPNPEEGIVRTISMGGDTDTNAAIAGALLGAVCGIESLPQRWIDTVTSCRPSYAQTGVTHPRPSALWPHDSLDLAKDLLSQHSPRM